MDMDSSTFSILGLFKPEVQPVGDGPGRDGAATRGLMES